MVIDQNIISLFISVIFVCTTVLIAFLLYKFCHLRAESVRKLIHITVSNWVFILIYGFNTLSYALIGPIMFIIINTVFVYGGFGRYLGMGDRKRDNGLIYFPITLLILTLCKYKNVMTDTDVILGVLAMGYGDGLAALIGSKVGKHKYIAFGATKSYEGSFVMFITVLIIALILSFSLPIAFLLALCATILESVTPLGLDNLTVPIITALIGALAC